MLEKTENSIYNFNKFDYINYNNMISYSCLNAIYLKVKKLILISLKTLNHSIIKSFSNSECFSNNPYDFD